MVYHLPCPLPPCYQASPTLQLDSQRGIIHPMRIAIGSDHAGFILKEEIVNFLAKKNFEFKDFGTLTPDPIDYPEIGTQVAEAVTNGEFDCGILVCGSGIGMSITANKVPGIRAALCGDTFCARFSRIHNDANILVLGERVTGVGIALDVVETWLSTEYPGEERHANRIRKIAEVEKKFSKGGI